MKHMFYLCILPTVFLCVFGVEISLQNSGVSSYQNTTINVTSKPTVLKPCETEALFLLRNGTLSPSAPAILHLPKRTYKPGVPFAFSLRVRNSKDLTKRASLVKAFYIEAYEVGASSPIGNFERPKTEGGVFITNCGAGYTDATATNDPSGFRPREEISLYWIPPNLNTSATISFRAVVKLTNSNDTWKVLASSEVVGSRKECFVGNGASYRGTGHVTVSGIECQRWDSDEPHSHFTRPDDFPDADLTSNFCRNMDNDTAPWCYTTMPHHSKRYETCAVPKCTDDFPSYFTDFGPGAGDAVLGKGRTKSGKIKLKTPFQNSSFEWVNFMIFEDGVVAFGNDSFPDHLQPTKFPLNRVETFQFNAALIAPFWTNIHRKNSSVGTGLIFFRETQDKITLRNITEVVNRQGSKSRDISNVASEFKATNVVVVTWYLVSDGETPTADGSVFQVVVAFGDDNVFLIYNYHMREWRGDFSAQIGYDISPDLHLNIGTRNTSTASVLSSYVKIRSNVGVAGQWVLLIPANTLSNNPKTTTVSPTTSIFTTEESTTVQNHVTDRMSAQVTTDEETTKKSDLAVSFTSVNSNAMILTATERQAPRCTLNQCSNGGTCIVTENSFICECRPGFVGRLCSRAINECASSPCSNRGVCRDHINYYSCVCPPDYSGVNCELLVDRCNPNPCKNEGICQSIHNSYTCSCVSGTTGTNCEHHSCVDGQCLDSRPCISDSGKQNCSCDISTNAITCTNTNDGHGNISHGGCPYDKSGYVIKGVITWSATKASSTSYAACPTPSTAQAIRHCDANGFWGLPDMSQCGMLGKTSRYLHDLSLVPITNDNSVEVLQILTNLTSLEAGSLRAYDITNIATTLTNIFHNLILVSYEDELNLLLVIENILMSSREERSLAGEQSSANARLISVIDVASSKLSLTNSTSTIIESNTTSVAAHLVNVIDFYGSAITFTMEGNLSLESQPPTTNTSSNIQASISLPSSIFLTDESLQRKIYYTLYKSPKLFEFVSYASFPDASQNTFLSSQVISASIGNRRVSNLSEPVKIVLTHNSSLQARPGFPKCVFWVPSSVGDGYWSSDGCNVNHTSSTQTICHCSHLTNFAVLLDVYNQNRNLDPTHELILRILTYIGCGLSVTGLLITLLSYIMFGKIKRDAPAKILVCLCVSLIALNLFYLSLTPAYYYNSKSCVAVSVLLHYFLLSALTWMGLEALNMYIALIRVFNTYYRKYILKMSLVGWGVPLIIVVIALCLHFLTEPVYIPMDDYKICWIRKEVFYGCLVAPFALIFAFNCIIFCLVLAQLLGLRSRKLKHRDSRKNHRKSSKHENGRRLRGAIGLMALLGITWGLAFVSIGEASLPLSYLFVIFNSTQGFWVFIFHCVLKKDIANIWQKILTCQGYDKSNKSGSKRWRSSSGVASGAGSRCTSVASRTQSLASIKSPPSISNSRKGSEATSDNKNDISQLSLYQSDPVGDIIIDNMCYARNEQPDQQLGIHPRLVRRIPRPSVTILSCSVAVQTDPGISDTGNADLSSQKFALPTAGADTVAEMDQNYDHENSEAVFRSNESGVYSDSSSSSSCHVEADVYENYVSESQNARVESTKLSPGADLENTTFETLSEELTALAKEIEIHLSNSSLARENAKCLSDNPICETETKSLDSSQSDSEDTPVTQAQVWKPPLVIKRSNDIWKQENVKSNADTTKTFTSTFAKTVGPEEKGNTSNEVVKTKIFVQKSDQIFLRKIRFSGKEKTPGVKSFVNTRFSNFT
ncbi:uncharacterized protein LOC101242091 [Ciona intestinalis]